MDVNLARVDFGQAKFGHSNAVVKEMAREDMAYK